MSEKILVPTLGESINEATVSKWLKNKGDKVEADEPVVELETDKVNLEVPSPVSGILTEINSKDGEVVEVGALLGKVLEKASERLNKIEIKKVGSKSLKENNIVNLEVSSKKPKVFNDKNDQENNLSLFKSSSAFFESNENNYFIPPSLSSAYFFIHQSPLYIFNLLKEKYSSTQAALNELFNFQNSSISQHISNSTYQVLENRQSWNINTNSWIDPNVQSTYRGLIIPHQDFFKDPQATFTKVIFHLIQAGIKFEVNYNLIDQFIEENPPQALKSFPDLSKKEKKLLLNNLDQNLLNQLNYQI